MSYVPPQIPLPVQPVDYAAPNFNSRPGILIAVGIISVVLGCFGVLASAGGAFMSLGFMMLGAMPPAAFAPSSGTVTLKTGNGNTTVTGGMIVVQEEDGLDEALCRQVANVMGRKRELNDHRDTQLRALLAQAGKKIFPGDPQSLNPATIRANISESGTIPGVNEGGGSTYFIVGTGRIEV